LKKSERDAQALQEVQNKIALDARQQTPAQREQLQMLEAAANEKLAKELRKSELRVFVYRLLLTLPLLAIAAWLLVKKCKGTYWTFVWSLSSSRYLLSSPN
jgi:hypothetical protein